MYFTVYKVTNLLDGKYYIGKHQTKNLDDEYLGSGIHIVRAIKAHGKENFSKEILFIFDNEDAMNKKEAELVTTEVCLQEDTYNLSPGGKGGFGYINASGINLGDNNIMRRDRSAIDKMVASAKKTRAKAPEKYVELAKKNLAISHERRRGQKDPEHGAKMKIYLTERWKTNREEIRDYLSSTFEITTPTGETIQTNRLEDWCKSNNIPHVSLWNTSRTGKVLSKGRGKGYTCKKI